MNGYLLDENMPSRVRFVPSLPLIHSTSLGPSPSDSSIWDFARINRYVIITKDSDFSSRIMLSNPPPWVVRFRIGNLRRTEFHALVAKSWPQIERLLLANKLINVYRDRIEAVS